MRTKTLALALAIGAVSLATTMAQVYSVNIVGYVNTTIPTGFSIIANPLNASGGNTIGTVMPNPPASVTIYKFRNATGTYLVNTFDSEFQEWSDAAMSVNPGEGLFIRNPAAPFTWTFVGEVATGTTSVDVFTGFNLIASTVPQQGLIQTDLGYVPSTGTVGDVVYKYNNATGLYQVFNYDAEFMEWGPEPTINVGEGFFLKRGGTSSQWTRTFNVN